MNKKFAKIVGVLCLASVCAGFAYAHASANAQKYTIQEKSFTEHVHYGDTFWSIAEQHFNAENEGMCFEEFMDKIKHLPENKDVFFEKNGKGRMLQATDKIKFVIKVKVANE